MKGIHDVTRDGIRVVTLAAGGDEEQVEMDLSSPKMQDQHVAEFVQVPFTKGKSLLSCTMDDSLGSSAAVLLSMASYYTDSLVTWDPENRLFPENGRCSALNTHPYRGGYERPDI